MKNPPENGQSVRLWKTKLWYFCHPNTGGKCDGQWRVHKPSECKGKANSASHYTKMQEKRKAQSETPSGGQEKKIKLAAAYQATLDSGRANDDNISQGSGDTVMADEE